MSVLEKKSIDDEIAIVEYSYFPISIDILLRWLSLGLYREMFGLSNDALHVFIFIIFQIFVVAITISIVLYREYVYRKSKDPFRRKVSESIDIVWEDILTNLYKERRYEIMGSSFSVILRVFLIGVFSYMFTNVCVDKFILSGHQGNLIGIIFTVTFIIHGTFIFLLSIFCVSIPKPNLLLESKGALLDPEEYIKNIIPSPENRGNPDNPIDQNDQHILDIEGNVKNFMNRVEAYVLESVMFGALAFSGFLTIIASDRDKVDYLSMRMFGHNLIDFFLDLLIFEFKHFEEYRLFSTNPDHLLILIMFETVICSMCFLLVIAMRLKFSSIAEKIDSVISLARSYNNKEEELYLLRLQHINAEYLNMRLHMLSKKINQYILNASDLIAEVSPVVEFMSLFRNMGVLLFLIIIITSLLFFHQTIAMLFVFFSVFAFGYKRFDDWYRAKRLQRIMSQLHKDEL